jgi:D-arabinose 5-phosphate isomerase GutQ
MNIVDEIARVLDIEIEALRAVRQNISPAFVRAVEVIAACRGQVVVSGIGKSGIIGTEDRRDVEEHRNSGHVSAPR